MKIVRYITVGEKVNDYYLTLILIRYFSLRGYTQSRGWKKEIFGNFFSTKIFLFIRGENSRDIRSRDFKSSDCRGTRAPNRDFFISTLPLILVVELDDLSSRDFLI